VSSFGVGLGIDGALTYRLQPHADDRGSLTELVRADWLPTSWSVAQANLSVSRERVLRGMHFHRTQADYWCMLTGVAFVALFDLREGSPTWSAKVEILIDADRERVGLFIPPGVAHGFQARTAMTLLYLVDRTFDGTDEFGVAWDDPGLAIAWPDRSPVLSERDRSNPPLSAALDLAPGHPAAGS
jgi:dTDP-4-dehydrorhamnose 3,5-epimerase